MDETRERFLTAIVGRLGAERIVELHLFSPLRSGVMETGVAVVAVLPDLNGAEAEAGRRMEAETGENDASADVTDVTEVVAEAEAPAAPLPDAAAPEPSPYLDTNAPPAEETVAGVETPAESRHVVFTALYRHTRKGPERGKWFFEVTAQADAPLATVDTVVRGVLHRSKDLTETERLSGEQLRALLAEPAWRTTP
ncbi:MAG: hypothetical protein ACYC3L_17080 [Gemmatimonadaceae bacterium]